MANKIILKKSNIAAKVPLDTDLDFGELALNYRDGALYYKDHTGTVRNLIEPPPSGAGSGADADFLDGIDSTEFLRSNTDDQYTSGTLTFNNGTTQTFAAGANINFNNTGVGRLEATLSTGTATVTVTDTTGLVAGQTLTKISGAGAFGVAATILTVDGPTQFTASINHATAGAIVFSAGRSPFNVVSSVKVNNLNADLLDGRDSGYFYSPDNPPPATNEQDTLQTVTERGQTGGFSTTDQKITLTNTTQSNETITDAALLVLGGMGVEKDFHIRGDLHIVGEGTLRFGPYDVGSTDGNLWWVRTTGLDLDPAVVNGAGEQQWTAFGSLKHALKFANFGDTILVQPGEYEEEFPLYVPAGVSIRGAGLRETQIRPTLTTNDKDAFLLSGDSTISDFTVKNFFYNSTDDTGYAFRFATYSATLTSGIATVTVSDTTGLVAGQKITKISGAGAFGTNATVLSVDSATQFTASVNHATSGTIVFSTAKMTNRSTYIERCTILTKGSVTSSTDPYGFNEGDAGRGALIDGALLSRDSIETAMLFNEVTFIVPNSRGIIMTNGARSEILTSFFYFADLAVEGKVGTAGRGMDGKTYITLEGLSGSWLATNTITLYDTDNTTVIATATIESVSGNRLTIDGSASGFVLNADREPKLVDAVGDAQLDTGLSRFGTASLQLDGTGDYIEVDSNPDFNFGTGDWTIDFWVYRTTSPGSDQVLVDMRTSATQVAPLIYLNSSYQPVLNVNGSDVITAATAVSLNTWTHIEIAKSSNSTRLFVGGTQTGSTYTDNNNYIQGPIRVGLDYAGNTGFTGRIDEFRVSKGIGRHTANFSTRTAAYSGDADTVLLLHFNGTDGATAIVDDGINVQDVRSSAGGTATGIIRYDRAEFGAEMRSIASAYVYGNEGIKADGVDVTLQLMAHNFAYIGTGADLTNDKSSVNQANEVIEVNGGRVYYNSVDQSGDFRVGDFFRVNFETGAVSFSGGSFDVTAIGSINFIDGLNQTTVSASEITTGTLVLSGSTIGTSTGDITIDPSGDADIYLNGDTIVTGLLSISTLTHTGLQMSDGGTSGTNAVDTLVTYTKSLTITTDWQDTGIAGTDLATGTYIVQLYANDTGSGGTSNNEYYSGTMSWYSGTTSSSVALPTDEIQLHRAGASSDAGLYLRTARADDDSPGPLKLQIYSNLPNASASNYVFKFRRMI